MTNKQKQQTATKTPKTNKEPCGKSIKIKLYPNKAQKDTLQKWFGSSRYIYNKCLDYIIKKKDTKLLNKKNLRSLFINNENYQTENKWLLDIPYDIRDEAMNDLLKNYGSNFAKSSNKPFNIKFRSRKDKHDSIAVLSKHWNHKRGIYSGVFTSTMKSSQGLPKILDYDSRIIRDNVGNYYICIPRPLNSIKCENQVFNVISLDPGVRTFMTGYNPEGEILECGANDISKIGRLLHYKNKLQSKITGCNNSHKKKSLTKAWNRMSLKIHNMVTDEHKKLSKYLCSTYKNVLIPKLNFHNFRGMNKKTKSKMACLRHCEFVDILISKSREYGCKVIGVTEEWTSKVCSCCGNPKFDLGSNKEYNCNVCGNVFDRDINGARNILLKYLTELQN